MNLVAGQTPSKVTNVTALTSLDVSNAGVDLENRTVNYFDQAKGYLVYPYGKLEHEQY